MKYIVGALAGWAVVALAALIYVAVGGFDASASAPHRPLTAWVLETAMERSVKAHADEGAAPARFTPDQVQAGFAEFDAECAMCHGAPGVERAEWAKGLRPGPPDLAKAVGRWSKGELHWIVRNGLKMTGMPAMGEHHSEREIWNIVAFLETLPGMTPEDYQRMRADARPSGASEPETEHSHSHR